jgi:hypothetical protein
MSRRRGPGKGLAFVLDVTALVGNSAAGIHPFRRFAVRHGHKGMAPWGYLCLPLLLSWGCDAKPVPAVPEAPVPSPVCHFDPSTAGTVRGRVTWQGDLPVIAPLKVVPNEPYGPPVDRAGVRDNPNAPRIDPYSRAVADAAVCLQGVTAEAAHPWDHGPVCVEQRDGRIHVLQDGVDSRVGFVRRADTVVLVSRDTFPHALRAAGAAFFTLAFPDPDQPLERRFTQKGIVELSSGVEYYWMRGHLFVDDNPYYARTDAKGRFVLKRVPPGKYRLVCWHPSWIEDSHERDPETSLIARLYFRSPVTCERAVELRARGEATVDFQVSTAFFLAGAGGPANGR